MSVTRESNWALITFEDDNWKTGATDIFTVVDGTTPFYSGSTWQYDGKNVLRSGAINHSGTSETTITFSLEDDGLINLNYIISSENNYDWLHVLLDGTEILKKSGTSSSTFTEYEQTVTKGTHILILRYTKDGSASSGSDAVAIGYLKLTGVIPPYAKKYLMTDFNRKVYGLTDGVVTEITALTINDLNKADSFTTYGFDSKPTSEQITSLTKPVIYRWSDGDPPAMKAAAAATPAAQTIQAAADMNDPTIIGITEMTSVYAGVVNVSYSYDGTTYTAPVDMAAFLAMDVAELYAGLLSNKQIFFKFILTDAASSLTNFVITYLNP